MTEQHQSCGKRLDDRKWVTGYMCVVNGETYIISPDPSAEADGVKSFAMYEVDPATVGRCTGLRDCEGTMIFEGHYLGEYCTDDDGIEDLFIIGVVTYWADEGRWVLADENGYCNDWTLEDDAKPENWKHLFVCGNIHDHPELGDESNA